MTQVQETTPQQFRLIREAARVRSLDAIIRLVDRDADEGRIRRAIEEHAVAFKDLYSK